MRFPAQVWRPARARLLAAIAFGLVVALGPVPASAKHDQGERGHGRGRGHESRSHGDGGSHGHRWRAGESARWKGGDGDERWRSHDSYRQRVYAYAPYRVYRRPIRRVDYDYSRAYCPPRVVYSRPRYYDPYPRSSFSIGITISNVPRAGYGYWDPYCDDRFSTLDAYLVHARYEHHPCVVELVELRTGDPVCRYEYGGDGWELCD